MLKAGATHDAWVPAVIAAVLAALGAVSLQVAGAMSVLAEEPVELAWLLGWALLMWSILAVATALLMAWRSRGATSASLAPSILVIGGAIVALAIAVALHPPFGAGAGIG